MESLQQPLFFNHGSSGEKRVVDITMHGQKKGQERSRLMQVNRNISMLPVSPQTHLLTCLHFILTYRTVPVPVPYILSYPSASEK